MFLLLFTDFTAWHSWDKSKDSLCCSCIMPLTSHKLKISFASPETLKDKFQGSDIFNFSISVPREILCNSGLYVDYMYI